MVAFAQLPVFARPSEPTTLAQTTEEPAPAASAEAQAQTQADTTVANEETKFSEREAFFGWRVLNGPRLKQTMD